MIASSRRTFLKAGATVLGAVALTTLPSPLWADLGSGPEPLPPIDDPRLKELAFRAIEAARPAGAGYADVRLTHTRMRAFSGGIGASDAEAMTVGVRALVNGYWGFASGPVWSPDELARLGREAVHQATVMALGPARPVELAPVPVIQDGHWVMPVERDPFEVSPFEINDFLASLELFAGRIGVEFGISAVCQVQEKAFASSLGSYCTQRTYLVEGRNDLGVGWKGKQGSTSLECLTPAGLGWEYFTADRIPLVREQPLTEEIRRAVEELKEHLALPVKPVEVGRYDTVFDSLTMARLVSQTLGRATQLDVALGYEANAGGTSYLNDPVNMVGSYQAGAPLLTLTANRAEPGGCAMVQWDDEGVEPDTFPLVTDGVLTDFQTTREAAGWLKDYYAKRGTPVRSHGCAAAPEGVDAPLVHTPNLVLAPGREAEDFDALVAGLGKGLAIKRAGLDLDFQAATGLGQGWTYEVKGGKRVARIEEAGFLFRSTELWKGLLALGGPAARRRYGLGSSKGEPPQTCYHSVTAPPAVVKQLTLIDLMRKA